MTTAIQVFPALKPIRIEIHGENRNVSEILEPNSPLRMFHIWDDHVITISEEENATTSPDQV